MTGAELIEILAKHPEYEVEVMTETMVCPIKKVDTDCFEAEQGLIFVIEADTSEDQSAYCTLEEALTGHGDGKKTP